MTLSSKTMLKKGGPMRRSLKKIKRELIYKVKVPIATAYPILEYAQNLGIHLEWLISDATEKALSSKRGLISIEEVVRVLLAIKNTPEGESMGFELGLATKIPTLGFWGIGIGTQSSGYSAFSFARRFFNLVSPAIRMDLERRHGMAVIVFEPTTNHGDLYQMLMEHAVVSAWKIASEVTGEPAGVLTIAFKHSEPEYFARYRQQLPSVVFEADVNAVLGPESLLDKKLSNASPASASLIEQQCELEHQQIYDVSAIFLADVREAIRSQTEGYASLTVVSSLLHQSPSGLKRRLDKIGTSFSNEVDAIRLQDACALLRNTRLSVAEISERLGYRDTANFSRAFKRLKGCPPSQFRKSNR